MKTYVIKKTLIINDKARHVLLTDGYSAVLELPHRNIAEKLIEVLNENSDSGCTYEVLPIADEK